MKNLNDIPNLEALRDTFVDQIYEKVFPYMRKNGYFDDPNNKILQRVRNFLERADNLTNLDLNKEDIEKEVNSLQKELLELLEITQKDKTVEENEKEK